MTPSSRRGNEAGSSVWLMPFLSIAILASSCATEEASEKQGSSTSCERQCLGVSCGDDGCGGSCGACAEGYACVAGSCRVGTPPASWICDSSYYDNGDGCDCDCGAYDPDCDAPDAETYNCAAGESCSDSGLCVGATTSVPSTWTCDSTYYDNSDGCDCDCGAYDPDCSDAGGEIYNCAAGESCNNAGECSGETSALPDTWTCPDYYYDADDGCNCECGAYDPDCTDSGATLYGCGGVQEPYCDPDGQCVSACEPNCGCTCDTTDGCDPFCDCDETCTETVECGSLVVGEAVGTSALYALSLVDGTTGYAVGAYNTVQKLENGEWSELEAPTDCGGPSNTDYQLYGIDLQDANNGWAVGKWWDSAGSFYKGAMLKLVNGTWTCKMSAFSEGWNAIDLGPADDGWAVSRRDQVDRFTVGGAFSDAYPWPYQYPTKSLFGVSLLDRDNGWAVGTSGYISRLDAGAWNEFDSPTDSTLRDVATVSADEAWAVGDHGEVIRFDGTEWHVEYAATDRTLQTVAVDADGVVWAAGDNGTILRYESGEWAQCTHGDSSAPSIHALEVAPNGDLIIVGNGGYHATFTPTP